MPSGPLYYLIIFLAAVGVIGVKFGPQILKSLKPRPKVIRQQQPLSQVQIPQVQTVSPATAAGTFQLRELLSPTEKKLYKTLDQALNADNLRIFAKVKLDGLFVADNQSQSPILSLLAVDFLAIDPNIMEPAFVIMIEESMFNEAAGNELRAIREICATANLPVITIPAQPVYDATEVRERIMQGFGGKRT